jgi:hypothetical protein
MGKKHYPLKSHHIKRLITHVEKGGVLESQKDVPEAVQYHYSRNLSGNRAGSMTRILQAISTTS